MIKWFVKFETERILVNRKVRINKTDLCSFGACKK